MQKFIRWDVGIKFSNCWKYQADIICKLIVWKQIKGIAFVLLKIKFTR